MNKKVYMKKYKELNKDKIKKQRAEYRKQHKERLSMEWKEYYEVHKKKLNARKYDVRSLKPWKRNAFTVANVRITPKWADREKIEEIYKLGHLLGLHVDHIIPRNHPLVCGLHVHNNLQLLTHEQNSKKGNSFNIGEFQ